MKPQVLHPHRTDSWSKSVGSRNLHSFPVWGILVEFCFSRFFFVLFFNVLMNVSTNMARVTPTTDRVENPTSPSQYWQSCLSVWTPFADINNAMPRESARLNSYSYEIAFLKHAAVLVPLGGISIRLADARVRPLMSVKTHNGEPFTSTFEKWVYIISLQMCLWITQEGLLHPPNSPSRLKAAKQTRCNLSIFSTLDGSVRLKGRHPASQGNVKISHSPIALLINITH